MMLVVCLREDFPKSSATLVILDLSQSRINGRLFWFVFFFSPINVTVVEIWKHYYIGTMNYQRFNLLESCIYVIDFAIDNVCLKFFICINVSISLILDKKVALLQLCDDMPDIGLSGLLQFGYTQLNLTKIDLFL